MKMRFFIWCIHGLHVVIIVSLVLVFGEREFTKSSELLFNNLNVTMVFAREQFAYSNDLIERFVLDHIQVFPQNKRNKEILRRNTLQQELFDKAISDFESDQPLSNLIDRQLGLFVDTIESHFDYDSARTREVRTWLLKSGPYAWIGDATFNRRDQQDLLRNALITNMHIVREVALQYFSTRVVSCVVFPKYKPFRQSSVLCPLVGQKFTTTIFLSYDWGKSFLTPYGCKVWVNKIRCPIQDNAATFITTYDSSGPQPLNIRIEKHDLLTDSVSIFEKTYTINVQ